MVQNYAIYDADAGVQLLMTVENGSDNYDDDHDAYDARTHAP